MHKKVPLKDLKPEDTVLTPAYGGRTVNEPVPKYEIPEGELPPEAAYNLIHDELMLDGNSRLNLATFVTTWMELRCVNMLSRLWHAPQETTATGCSTIGSSEAAMLGGMALKWKWRERRKAQGKPHDKPNMVMGINVQVCWEKFCRYWEIEPRFVPMEGDRYCLTA